MIIPRRSRLEWIQHNRQPRSRVEAVGALLPKLVAPLAGPDAQLREGVRDGVGQIVDRTFRELCTLGRVDRRGVEILVSHPTAAAALRRQWLMSLVEHLDRTCRFVVSPEIRFCVGQGGEPFPGGDGATSPSPHGVGGGA
jgi:hypothetical protein